MNWGKFGGAMQAFRKSQFSIAVMNWVKLRSIYTAQDQHFKIRILNLWMNWENVCPNLSFTVQNKMVNSRKNGW